MSKINEFGILIGMELNKQYDIYNQLGEKIDGCPFKMTDDGIYDADGIAFFDAMYLVTGYYTFRLTKYKPSLGDEYLFVDASGAVKKSIFLGNTVSYYHFNAGNCFRHDDDITMEIKAKILKEMKTPYNDFKE